MHEDSHNKSVVCSCTAHKISRTRTNFVFVKAECAQRNEHHCDSAECDCKQYVNAVRVPPRSKTPAGRGEQDKSHECYFYPTKETRLRHLAQVYTVFRTLHISLRYRPFTINLPRTFIFETSPARPQRNIKRSGKLSEKKQFTR